MALLSVVRRDSLVPFEVVDLEGNQQPDVTLFLNRLVLRGRSAYTIRSYAFALAHFLSWGLERGLYAANITTSDIADYISTWRAEAKEQAAATTNHRLTVLAGFFACLIEARSNEPSWFSKQNPVPAIDRTVRAVPMRTRPQYQRADLRRRIPRRAHRQLSPDEIAKLFEAAHSLRDRAILRLLEWSGQRIGDWSDVHGQHGILGLSTSDFDFVNRTITVRLKGARDSHVVPVGEAFWPVYSEYLRLERGTQSHPAAWISLRKGGGRPLSYATFETAIRALGRRSGVHGATAHIYRHTFAQNMLERTDNLALVQAFLGHSSPETTAATYVDVPLSRLIEAIRQLEHRSSTNVERPTQQAYAFSYDAASAAELERLFSSDRHE